MEHVFKKFEMPLEDRIKETVQAILDTMQGSSELQCNVLEESEDSIRLQLVYISDTRNEVGLDKESYTAVTQQLQERGYTTELEENHGGTSTGYAYVLNVKKLPE